MTPQITCLTLSIIIMTKDNCSICPLQSIIIVISWNANICGPNFSDLFLSKEFSRKFHPNRIYHFYLEISSKAHFSPKRIVVIIFLGKRIFEMCICWRVLESPGARSTFGNILPQFSHKGRKYSLVEAIMGSAYLAGYELQLKRNIHIKNLERIFCTIMKV